MQNYKIAYISETSPSDKHAWSGTVHYVFEALKKQGYVVTALGPKKMPIVISSICKLINQLSLKFLNKRFDYRHSTIYSKAFGKLFTAALKKIEHDIIVVCGGTEYGAYIKTNRPIYYILDRTIEGALNYHKILTDLLPFSRKQSIATDKKAMVESTKVFFSSHWAAQHAKEFYKLPEEKVIVLPFGANLDKVPTAKEVLTTKDLTTVKLLLIGTYWNNKGADIALNTLNYLLKNNIKATLTVVGCQPPYLIKNAALTIIPFVDKNTKEGINELWRLYLSHHFFILPTRFDCTPIVFCEASSFGLPILTANTGGVAGHIKEGINGFLINYKDAGEAYAKKIEEFSSNTGNYTKLCISSRKHYDVELNWDSWGKRFKEEVITI